MNSSNPGACLASSKPVRSLNLERENHGCAILNVCVLSVECKTIFQSTVLSLPFHTRVKQYLISKKSTAFSFKTEIRLTLTFWEFEASRFYMRFKSKEVGPTKSFNDQCEYLPGIYLVLWKCLPWLEYKDRDLFIACYYFTTGDNVLWTCLPCLEYKDRDLFIAWYYFTTGDNVYHDSIFSIYPLTKSCAETPSLK